MAPLYQASGTQVWYQDKEVRSFPTPPTSKTDRNLSVFLGKTLTLSVVISFPTLTGSLGPLTGYTDPLKVSIIPTSITTLPSTVLKFSKNMDFLLSVLIVLRATL